MRNFTRRDRIDELKKEAYGISARAKESLRRASVSNQEALRILRSMQATLDKHDELINHLGA